MPARTRHVHVHVHIQVRLAGALEELADLEAAFLSAASAALGPEQWEARKALSKLVERTPSGELGGPPLDYRHRAAGGPGLELPGIVLRCVALTFELPGIDF